MARESVATVCGRLSDLELRTFPNTYVGEHAARATRGPRGDVTYPGASPTACSAWYVV